MSKNKRRDIGLGLDGDVGIIVVLVKKLVFRPVYHGLATSKYGGLQATQTRFAR